MNTETWKLSKFDVAERQLLQAIRLFFSRGDEVSIHTLAEAAGQVLYDTKAVYDISIIRDNHAIRPEGRSEWFKRVFRSRNFFKHANEDAHELHEFKATFNHFSLLDAVNLYTSVKKSWVPETLLFFSWFVLAYPGLLKDDDPVINAFLRSAFTGANPIDIHDFPHWAACLEELRSGRHSLLGVVLPLGLQDSV